MRLLLITSICALFSTIGFAQSDNCITATVIDLSSGTACVNGSTAGATSSNTLYGACNGISVNEVWYTYVSNGSQNDYQIDPGTMGDAEIVIYTGGCAGLLELCDNAAGGANLNNSWGIPPGTQVWIGVMSSTLNDGSFELCVDSYTPPPGGGNACAGAIPVCSGTTVVDMGPLNSSAVFPTCFGGAVNQDVWFTFDVLSSGTFEWSAEPSGISTNVELDWALFDVTGGCPGVEVDCNYNWDGGGNGINGQEPGGNGEFNPPSNLIAGNTYAIVIDFFSSGAIGTLDFNVDGGTAQIAPDANFTINPIGPTCASNLNVTINDLSVGAPDWTFGNGGTFSGNNPPDQNYNTPGTYAITASFGGACPSVFTQFVQLFGPLVVVGAATDETCPGDCDGTANVTTTGGSGIYNYAWLPGGQNTPDITGLCAGNQTVTVTDATCGAAPAVVIPVGSGVCPCLITNMTANIGACNAVPGDYQTTGDVDFDFPPATGQLIIEDCNGNQDVYNAPFVGPINYTITGQTPDGGACAITAYFTDDLTCTQNIPYVAPICPCNIDFFNAAIGLCDQNTNTYAMTGDVTFTSPPAGGTMIITVDNGSNSYDTIINPPYVSPQTYSISGIPSDGAASTITISFLNDIGCTSTIAYNAPTDCSCTVDIGTYSTNVTGDSPNNDVLCFGDVIDITSNNDWVGPTEMFNPPGPVYSTGVSWLMYSCPPTVALIPDLVDNVPDDPCFIGLISDTDMNDLNDLGWINSFPPGTFTDNIIYWVPITMYSQAGGIYSYTNGPMPCYELGAPFPVQYLPEFTSTDVEDCLAGTAVITVNGGLPELDGSNFVASNLLPVTASFANTTATDGGTITINGLDGGDMWSFTVDDGNGCPYTITGGPFPPLEDPGFSYTGGVWCTNDANQNVTLTGTAGGTYTSSPAGLTLNGFSGQITPSSSTPGTYDVTYTTGGICFDDSTVSVTIVPVPTVDPILNQTVCEGDNFADILITGTAGSTFDWVNDNVNIGLLAAGAGDILGFTGATVGAQSTANIDVTPTLNGCVGLTESFSLIVNQQEDAGYVYPATAWCTTEAAVVPAISGTAGGNFSSTPAGLTLNTGSGQITPGTSTPGTYDVTYTTAGICFDDSTITINIAATPTVDPVADQIVCEGVDFALIDFTGSAGTVFDWVNDNVNTGLAAAGSNDIAAFPGATLGGQEVSNIIVTPSAGTCVGTPENFSLTVNPQEDASFTYPAPQGWCTSDIVQNAAVTGTAGGTFTVLPAGLSINAASGAITPATSTAGTYDVTYTTVGICNDAVTVTVDIYAVPTVNPIVDQTVCVGDDFAAVNYAGTGTPTFDWTNDNLNVGLAAAGSGNIAIFSGATNGGTEIANITVTPSTLNCTGAQETFILTVNDLDDASFTYPAPQGWCTSDIVQNAAVTGTAGGTFTVLPAGLSINAASGAITPGTSTPGNYDVTYTTAGICNNAQSVNIDIYAVPDVNAVLDETICVGSNFADVIFGGSVAGTTFDWVNDNINIGMNGAGFGDILAFAGTTTGGSEVANFTVTPSTANCTGTAIVFTLTCNDLDDASFDYPNGLTYCQTGTDPTANITGMAGGTFTAVATAGGPFLDINAATGVITLLSSNLGIYDITYNTNTAGLSLCPQTTTVSLVVTDSPVADFTIGIYCANDGDPLPAMINGGTSGAWSSTPGLSINPGTGLVDLDASTPGVYTITNDINIVGCAAATFNADITINELPNATISGATTICPLDPLPDLTIDFTAGSANWDITYVLDGVATTVNTGANPYTIAGAAIGTYDITTVTDGNGCTNALLGQAVVAVFPTPVITPLLNQYQCEGSDLLIQTILVNPAGSILDWTSTTDVGFGLAGVGQIGNFTGTNGTGAPLQTTVTVTPTSPDGCPGAPENFLVTINPLPVVSFTGGPLTGCEPLDVTFNNTTTPNSQNCIWDFGNGNVVNGCGPVSNVYMAGDYDVTLTVTTAEGCTSTDTYASYVSVSPQPVALFAYSPQEITVEDPVVDFTNSSVNANNYVWDFGDNSQNSSVENPIHLYPGEPDSYLVTLWAYNAAGTCYDSIQQLIPIKDVLIFYVPNIMTPDGDDYNETFKPIFTSGFDKYDYHLTIFNRWGEIVFESYDAEYGWNGHYGDGGLVQDGVYIWQIDFKESMSDKRHIKRGHVTVLK